MGCAECRVHSDKEDCTWSGEFCSELGSNRKTSFAVEQNDDVDKRPSQVSWPDAHKFFQKYLIFRTGIVYLNSCLEILTENKESYCSFGGGGGEKIFLVVEQAEGTVFPNLRVLVKSPLLNHLDYQWRSLMTKISIS